MSTIPVDIQLLTDTAQVPAYNAEDPLAIGADVYADLTADITLQPGERAVIPTGIAIAPQCFGYVRLAPKSGLSSKGIDLGGGVVDVSYRGCVGVVLINHGKTDFVVKHGMRVCQMIFEHASRMEFKKVDHLGTTQRGGKGWGSSGQ